MSLRILLIDDDPDRSAIVEQGLVGGGYRIVSRIASTGDLSAQVRILHPDVIIIDSESPSRDTLEHMRQINRENPKPIIMFVDKSDEQMTRQAISAGVSAYIVDGLSTHRVRPIVDVAIARFREFQDLREELARSKAALADRKIIDRAKGILMQQRGWTEEQAYQAMRRTAMEENKRLADIAQNIVSVAKLLNK